MSKSVPGSGAARFAKSTSAAGRAHIGIADAPRAFSAGRSISARCRRREFPGRSRIRIAHPVDARSRAETIGTSPVSFSVRASPVTLATRRVHRVFQVSWQGPRRRSSGAEPDQHRHRHAEPGPAHHAKRACCSCARALSAKRACKWARLYEASQIAGLVDETPANVARKHAGREFVQGCAGDQRPQRTSVRQIAMAKAPSASSTGVPGEGPTAASARQHQQRRDADGIAAGRCAPTRRRRAGPPAKWRRDSPQWSAGPHGVPERKPCCFSRKDRVQVPGVPLAEQVEECHQGRWRRERHAPVQLEERPVRLAWAPAGRLLRTPAIRRHGFGCTAPAQGRQAG